MKKILTTAGVSVLSTLALCGGVVGVLANSPSTKNKFNVSWSKTDLIGKNQENISNLEKEIIEKDNQILGQQATIDELNQMLAGPEKHNIAIPDEIVLSNGATLLDMNENIKLFSSTGDAGTKGLWKLDKTSGLVTQLSDVGYNYKYCVKMSDGRCLVFSSGSEKFYYLIDSSFDNAEKKDTDFSISIYYNAFNVYENNKYFIFGGTSGNLVFVYNKETDSLIRDQELYMSSFVVNNDYFIGCISSKIRIWNLVDNTTEDIETTIKYLPMITGKGCYLLSTTSLSKLDLETKEITIVKEGFSISGLGKFVELFKENIYYTTDGSFCLIDIDNETVIPFTFSSVERYVQLGEDSNKYLFWTGSNYYLADIVEGTSKSVSTSNITSSVIIENKYLVYNTSGKMFIYDIELMKNIVTISEIQGMQIKSYEDLGEGKYRLIADDRVGVFDSVNNTFVVVNIIV